MAGRSSRGAAFTFMNHSTITISTEQEAGRLVVKVRGPNAILWMLPSLFQSQGAPCTQTRIETQERGLRVDCELTALAPATAVKAAEAVRAILQRSSFRWRESDSGALRVFEIAEVPQSNGFESERREALNQLDRAVGRAASSHAAMWQRMP